MAFVLKSKPNPLVFNSFPRCGTGYQAEMATIFTSAYISTIHLPEIFSVKEINTVTIFRKPEEAIASLIIKQLKPESSINKYEIYCNAWTNAEVYKKYIYYAKINKDIIYIEKFENLINDTVKHFENIANYFNINLCLNYKNIFLNTKLSNSLLYDKHEGHLPRPKDYIRLSVEENVKKLTFIQELNKEYEEFISQYATYV